MPFPAKFDDFGKATKKWFYDGKKTKWGSAQNNQITVQSKTSEGFKLKTTLGYPGNNPGVNSTEATFGIAGLHKLLKDVTFKLSPDTAAMGEKATDGECSAAVNFKIPQMDSVKFTSSMAKGKQTNKLETLYRHKSLATLAVNIERNCFSELALNVGVTGGDKKLGLSGGVSVKVENKKFAGEDKKIPADAKAETKLTSVSIAANYCWNDKVTVTGFVDPRKLREVKAGVLIKACKGTDVAMQYTHKAQLFEVAGNFTMDDTTSVMVHGDTTGRLHTKLSSKFADTDMGMDVFTGYKFSKKDNADGKCGGAFATDQFGVAFTFGSQ